MFCVQIEVSAYVNLSNRQDQFEGTGLNAEVYNLFEVKYTFS